MPKQNQRALNKAMRDLDRERMKMEQQEKKVIADIKKLAKDNQMDAVKIMAKDLVRTRRQARKFMLMKANIQVMKHYLFILQWFNDYNSHFRRCRLRFKL